MLGHVDVFSAILRERDTSLALEGLNELALTTAVIGRAAVDGNMIVFILCLNKFKIKVVIIEGAKV